MAITCFLTILILNLGIRHPCTSRYMITLFRLVLDSQKVLEYHNYPKLKKSQ
jgi:hypothetical protein